MFAEASDDEVLAFCRPLVREMADHGTTTLELKTGYGLSVEGELRQARLARRLAEEAPQTCTVTLLACHAVPEGMEREAWVRDRLRRADPGGRGRGAGRRRGRLRRGHRLLARGPGAVAEAAARGPAAAMPRRPARALRRGRGRRRARRAERRPPEPRLGGRHRRARRRAGDRRRAAPDLDPVPARVAARRRARCSTPGAAVAIASDCNPGTSPVLSMPEAIATACSLYGLDAARGAASRDGERRRGCSGSRATHGTLAPGRPADLVVLEGDAFRQVPYRPGHNPVLHTYVGGRKVAER